MHETLVIFKNLYEKNKFANALLVMSYAAIIYFKLFIIFF